MYTQNYCKYHYKLRIMLKHDKVYSSWLFFQVHSGYFAVCYHLHVGDTAHPPHNNPLKGNGRIPVWPSNHYGEERKRKNSGEAIRERLIRGHCSRDGDFDSATYLLLTQKGWSSPVTPTLIYHKPLIRPQEGKDADEHRPDG